MSAGPSSGSTGSTGSIGSTGFTGSTGGQANVPQAQQVASGVIDFPLPGHKSAPKKFKGKHSDVIPFIHFYERLCIKYHVTDDTEKVENITQYCSRSVRKFMEALPSYVTPNWDQFVKDVKKFYEADKDQRRFKVRDLEKLVKHSRSKSMNSMAA